MALAISIIAHSTNEHRCRALESTFAIQGLSDKVQSSEWRTVHLLSVCENLAVFLYWSVSSLKAAHHCL